MALSGLPSQPPFKTTTQKLDINHEACNGKLLVPLEINLAGRNLKISDYNELINLNNINNNCRRINTLTIRTVSTYKKRLSNDEHPLEDTSKSEVNKINLINDESKFKQIENSKFVSLKNENIKLNNEKSAYSTKESETHLNTSFRPDEDEFHQSIGNQSNVKTKLNNCNVDEINFLRNARLNSSLKRQLSSTNKFSDLNKSFNSNTNASSGEFFANNESICDDQKQNFTNNINIDLTNLNKNKMFKSNESDFKLNSQNLSAISNQNIMNKINIRKEFLNSLEHNHNNNNLNQFNSRTNFKDDNNNSKLKTSNSNRFLHPQYKSNVSNMFQSNSLTRKSNKKLSRQELSSDEFVSELKDRIANNNLQATSSPAIQLKSGILHLDENLTKNRRQLILDTNTMPSLRNGKTSSLLRNESFQKATESQFKYIPSTQRKNLNIKTNETQNLDNDLLDCETLPKKVFYERFSYASSQVANGYCPNLNETTSKINDLRLNDTCTTDDWNTTMETTNLDARFIDEDKVKKKKCDKYGFFINDEHVLSDQTENAQNKRLKNEIEKRREMKWLDMLNNWDKYMQKKWPKICTRCRKGIPVSLRGTAWFYLCAAHKQKKLKPDVFALLDEQIGNENVNDEITKDLHRQFPNHEMFAGTNTIGQQDLFKVLKCFSIVKPEIAYCQGQAPLASVLLMHLPVEDAFWCLIQLSDHYLPGYFNPGLETIQTHGQMLNSFLKRFNNNVYKILKKQKIDPNFYMTEWFMCLFARTLPWPTVLRVWDMFFCEGIKIIFRVALVILCSLEPDFKKAKCRNNDKLGETLAILKNLPKKYLTEEYLMPKVIEMNLSEKDLENEHLIIMKKMKKEMKKKK